MAKRIAKLAWPWLVWAVAGCAHPSGSKPVTDPVAAAGAIGYDARLSRFAYPFPVRSYAFRAQGQDLEMAYMDLNPHGVRVIVLLHGKNFSGAYFREVAEAFAAKGFRVIMPDQIGFGKSTKPAQFQYTFHALGTNTLSLLDHLKVSKFTLLGHSMGGMLATRIALMQPERVERLILENPIGLEDWKRMTAYKSVDELYASELKSNETAIKNYQLEYYYNGVWKAEYQPWLDMLVGWQRGPDYPRIAWNNALTSEMVFTQPVFYEFEDLAMPVLLINGLNDKTAIGKSWARPEDQKKMGNYPRMGREVIRRIPRGRLVELKGLGHAPHIEAFDRFIKSVFDELKI